MLRMSEMLRSTMALLLVVVLGLAAVAQPVSVVPHLTAAASSAPACKCCNFDPANCATPSCCVTPTRPQAPAAPASLPASNRGEWQALATPSSALVATPLLAPNEPSFSPCSLLPLRTVPIFQRACSY